MIIKIKTILTLLVLLAAPNIVLALTCSDLDGAYVTAQDGQYLGFFGNQFASESINNTFGSYGSQFSPTSVRNQFSNYGSQFGSYSANNNFSSLPPAIYKYGEVIAYLTSNNFIGGGVSLGAINCNFISSFAKTSLPQIPSSLTGLAASDGTFTDEVYLSWDSAIGAISYDVYFSTTQDGNRIFIDSTTMTSMSVSGGTPGTTYYYFVFPINSAGSGTGEWNTGFVAAAPASNPGSSPVSSSSFNLQTLSLSAPCVEVLNNGQSTGLNGGAQAYAITMVLVGESFQVTEAVELAESSNCATVFDSATGLYTDQVSVDGQVYQIVLQYQSGITFSVLSAEVVEGSVSSLWRVSNGTNEVIIGGSIHILKPTDFPLPSAFLEAYALAEILVTEVTLDDLNAAAALSYLLLTTDGSTLSSSLTLSTYQVLNTQLSNLGISIASLENLKAIWVAQVLAIETLNALGFGAGVDEYFMNLAQQDGKPNWGLETVASQFLALNNTHAHLTSNEIIVQAMSEVQSEDLLPDINGLINAWRNGDTATLNSDVVEVAKIESMADYNILFRDRNAAWIPQIIEFLETPALEFVLVGVGHLVGSESVLQMLTDLGYQVERY